MRWYWITHDNVVVDLMSEPFLLMEDVAGHWMPPFQRNERWISALGVITGIRADAREVFLPLLVRADNLTSALRLCARYWNPLVGDGKLQVVDDGENTRELPCRYAGGLEGDGKNSGAGWQKIGLRLRALQPYWQDTQYQNYQFALDPPVLFFQTSFFPLHISKGTIDGSISATNPGDVDTYPLITAHGPLTYLSIQNLTTSKIMEFPALSMTSSDVLTLDTRPGVLSVKLNGNNAFSLMSSTSSLWQIILGSNSLKITTAGTTSNSYVNLSFAARFLTV